MPCIPENDIIHLLYFSVVGIELISQLMRRTRKEKGKVWIPGQGICEDLMHRTEYQLCLIKEVAGRIACNTLFYLYLALM